ncbi:MAG: hypothetical protein AAF721_19395, partial [Myxococcota bacterium]
MRCTAVFVGLACLLFVAGAGCQGDASPAGDGAGSGSDGGGATMSNADGAATSPMADSDGSNPDGGPGPDDGPGPGEDTGSPDPDSGSDDAPDDGDDDGEPVEIPTELADLELHQWGTISQNTLADVDPCPQQDCAWSATEGQSGVINDWTGGAFATEEGGLGGLIYWGGGHGGYYGNEVYVFDLETLHWERRSEPTDGQTPGDSGTYDLDLSTGLWWDGAPAATHTYDGVSYHPGTNSFVLLTTSDAPAPPWVPTGFLAPYTSSFSFDTGTWTQGTDAREAPGAIGFMSTAYDEARDLFWGWSYPEGTFSSYDPNTDTWQSYPQGFLTNLDHVSAIEPTHDLYVTLEFRSAGAI